MLLHAVWVLPVLEIVWAVARSDTTLFTEVGCPVDISSSPICEAEAKVVE